ncbi:unnamed protein product [Paramecium sonneborni]|uniref:Uncharacterized protein n=1 Tax=Paramecium sonneborni TaxID=65129 RepID=A0A8S1LUA5_9CILI|nr:unnamed protein product [Paramecium sonneborni]
MILDKQKKQIYIQNLEFKQLVKQIKYYCKHNNSLKNVNKIKDWMKQQKNIKLFLLNRGKKEYLESIQEEEITKKQPQFGQSNYDQKINLKSEYLNKTENYQNQIQISFINYTLL